MSIIGKCIKFKNKDFKSSISGIVIDKVLTTSLKKKTTNTKYLVEVILKNQRYDFKTYVLVKPKHILFIEEYEKDH